MLAKKELIEMEQPSRVKDLYLRNSCCVCLPFWWLEEVGGDLVVDLFLICVPAAYASGFLVASGLYCTGARCTGEQLLIEGLEFQNKSEG